jgi:predicted MFS family arabinose efflux permease
MLHQVGAFLGSWLGGVFVEATGSYDGMWLLDMALAAAAAALALTIREPATAPKTAPSAAGLPALASAAK